MQKRRLHAAHPGNRAVSARAKFFIVASCNTHLSNNVSFWTATSPYLFDNRVLSLDWSSPSSVTYVMTDDKFRVWLISYPRHTKARPEHPRVISCLFFICLALQWVAAPATDFELSNVDPNSFVSSSSILRLRDGLEPLLHQSGGWTLGLSEITIPKAPRT